MPTINELGKKYAVYLKEQKSSPTVSEDIVKKIKSLTYSKSGEHLSSEDLDEIVSAIESALNSTNDGRHYIIESEDSSKLIEMIKMIRQEVKK